jgi:hypothetical protein
MFSQALGTQPQLLSYSHSFTELSNSCGGKPEEGGAKYGRGSFKSSFVPIKHE